MASSLTRHLDVNHPPALNATQKQVEIFPHRSHVKHNSTKKGVATYVRPVGGGRGGMILNPLPQNTHTKTTNKQTKKPQNTALPKKVEYQASVPTTCAHVLQESQSQETRRERAFRQNKGNRDQTAATSYQLTMSIITVWPPRLDGTFWITSTFQGGKTFQQKNNFRKHKNSILANFSFPKRESCLRKMSRNNVLTWGGGVCRNNNDECLTIQAALHSCDPTLRFRPRECSQPSWTWNQIFKTAHGCVKTCMAESAVKQASRKHVALTSSSGLRSVYPIQEWISKKDLIHTI